jgi:hypothetical protein
LSDWVFAVERAYVAAATRGNPKRGNPSELDDPKNLPRARAAIGAVASRYLAVGTPRTLGLVAEPATFEEAALSVTAHRTWFSPREIRCAESVLAHGTGGVLATLDEVLACDIVCVHSPIAIRAGQLRRGTHVNVLATATLDDDLRRLAMVTSEAGLGALAAGLVDGRQLDELTVFFLDDAQIALGAL